MRSIHSGGKLFLLLIFTCFACGGGGGGGVTTLADLQAEISIPNPGETATVLVQVLSDGTIRWAGAVPVDLVPDVTGLTINRAADGSVLADLLGAGAFDAITGTTSGTATITPAEAAALAADPADYLVTLLTSTKPPATGGLGTFTAAEWHTLLLGTNESPVADAAARGAATFRVVSPTTISFVIAMVQPAEGDVTLAHIHVGPAGVNGIIVLDLEAGTATRDAAAGTLSGTVTVDGETLARIATDLGGFYCNVHTATAPNGIARGQLVEGTIEMTVAMLGSAEVPTVVDGNARGGATLEFTSFTGGQAILAFDSATETIDDVIGAHIHAGDAGTPGPILVSLMGADYATSPSSHSAESAITYTQKDLTRILANPTGFYANLHTNAAPNGLVRGQCSVEPRTAFASLSGAEETTPAAGTGTMRVIFTGAHSCEYTITMASPPASDITNAHIHDGAAGVDGPILVDLFENGDAVVSSNTINGTAAVPGRTVARVLAGTPGGSALAGAGLPSTFYGNVHTLANPGGTARGQLQQLSGATPPANLSYTSPVTYVTGQPITPNAPTSLGGTVTSYGIAPALSAGLSLDPTSGILSGTPTATRAQTDYTVTASNAGGSTTATLTITVDVGPPLSLSYTSPVGYIVGTPITPLFPVTTGGAIATYSVNPALPGGLNLNGTTGVISGTPNTPAAAQNYVVTGTNAAPGGQVQATVNITVTASATAPSNLVYTTPVSYPTGYAITNNTPSVSGTTPITFSATSLPPGLIINSSTGVISGTPTTVAAAANFTVTATNSAGNTQATVNITVTLGKPGPFTYSNDPNLGYTGFQIQSMSPTHTGGGPVSSYSINPALPTGLGISASTGIISGTPQALTPQNPPGYTSYTVTATNATGSTTTTVQINVPY